MPIPSLRSCLQYLDDSIWVPSRIKLASFLTNAAVQAAPTRHRTDAGDRDAAHESEVRALRAQIETLNEIIDDVASSDTLDDMGPAWIRMLLRKRVSDTAAFYQAEGFNSVMRQRDVAVSDLASLLAAVESLADDVTAEGLSPDASLRLNRRLEHIRSAARTAAESAKD